MIAYLTCFTTFLAVGSASHLAGDGIVGCPIFGCTPGGSFSFQLNLPKAAARVKWKSPVSLQPLPSALGCVGNSAIIVCPILTSKIKGYSGFSTEDGNVTWEDGILYHPPLPLMDIYGDIIGSDGQKLLQYKVDGTVLRPVIDLFPPMIDIFSLNIADNGIFLLTSSYGVVTTYFTNGVPGGTLTLQYTVNNVTGTFQPMATPVIKGHRSYILATFRADNTSSKENGLVRLFGVDLNDQFVGKIQVVWFLDLGYRSRREVESFGVSDDGQAVKASAVLNGTVLVYQDLVFVSMPLKGRNSQTNKTDFWAVQDYGKHAKIKYNSSLSIDDFSLYDTVPFAKTKSHLSNVLSKILKINHRNIFKFTSFNMHNADDSFKVRDLSAKRPLLWGSVKNEGKIIGFDIEGADIKIVSQIHLSQILQTSTRITSKVMAVRNEAATSDTLVFGVSLSKKTKGFNNLLKFHNNGIVANNSQYVVALETSPELSPHDMLLWIIPVPGDGEVRGQLAGIPSDMENKLQPYRDKSDASDIIVAYSVGKDSASIFAIY